MYDKQKINRGYILSWLNRRINMADRAILINDDGREIPVNAIDLTYKDKYKNYVCAGNRRGKECRAKMYFACGSVQTNNFRALTEHMKNCEFDETSKFHVVNKIDKTGYNTSVEELAIQFGVDRKPGERTGGKKPKGETGGGKTGGTLPDEDQPDDRETVSLQRKPKKLEELCKVLLQLHEDDQYGPNRVGDILIDDRSVDSFRQRDFQDGTILILVCEKTNQGAELRSSQPDNTLVLKGPYSRHYPPLLVKFKTTKKKWMKIVKEMDRMDKIAVIGRWYHHPERDDVIMCEYLPSDCIAILDKELFDE